MSFPQPSSPDQNTPPQASLNLVAPPAGTLYYEGFGKRFVAMIIDYMILFILYFAVSVIVGLALGMMVVSLNLPETFQTTAFILSVSLGILSTMLYGPMFESSPLQATLGKLALRLQVCNREGQRLTFRQAVIRNVCKIVFFKFTFGIAWLFPLWTQKKQALHDLVAQTLVIRRPD